MTQQQEYRYHTPLAERVAIFCIGYLCGVATTLSCTLMTLSIIRTLKGL